MSKLVISAIGPASSVQDGGRHGAQRYGLTPSGAMDRLALAAANCLVGNELFAAAIEIGPFGAAFTAHEGAVRVALAGAPRNADVSGRSVASDASMTLAERRIDLPPPLEGPIRVVMGPQDDEFGEDAKDLFLDSEWKISATSDRMGYRLEGPVIKHLHGHNIVSDGTVDGSIQVPGNGAPIVLMPDRGTSGGYPKIATVISADLGRFAQIHAGRGFRFKAVEMAEAQGEARKFAQLLRSLPDRVQPVETFDLNIEALQDANVAGAAVSAVDAGTWQIPSADALAQD